VDDRIIAMPAAGVGIRDYTAKFVQAFFDDCKTLSIESPEALDPGDRSHR